MKQSPHSAANKNNQSHHIARPDIANPPAIDHILHSQWDGWRTLGGYCHASSEVPPLSDHFAVFAAFELLDG